MATRDEMVSRGAMRRIIADYYNKEHIIIGCLGSHSALNVCEGAVSEGFKTWVFCQEGRDEPYSKYYKTVTSRRGTRIKGIVDFPVVLESFADVLKEGWQRRMREWSMIFVPNRSFWVYCGEKEIQRSFQVPIFGSRQLLHLEDREKEPYNYYNLLNEAGIRTPEKVEKPEDIDKVGLVMVKVPHKVHRLERGFFTAASTKEFEQTWQRLVQRGIVSNEDRNIIRIERFAMGPVCNVNFFYSPVNRIMGEEPLELMSTEWRFESNLDGLVRLSAYQQLELPKNFQDPSYIVVGHAAMTVRESLLRYLYEMGEKFAAKTQELFPPGIIGPFGLQCILEDDMQPTCYDVAFRIPGGDNITLFDGHPYLNALYGERMSTGKRIAREIRRAIEQDILYSIAT